MIQMNTAEVNNYRRQITIWAFDLFCQFAHKAPTRRGNSSLSHQMAPQSVDDRITLANEQIARLKDHGPRLLLG